MEIILTGNIYGGYFLDTPIQQKYLIINHMNVSDQFNFYKWAKHII